MASGSFIHYLMILKPMNVEQRCSSSFIPCTVLWWDNYFVYDSPRNPLKYCTDYLLCSLRFFSEKNHKPSLLYEQMKKSLPINRGIRPHFLISSDYSLKRTDQSVLLTCLNLLSFSVLSQIRTQALFLVVVSLATILAPDIKSFVFPKSDWELHSTASRHVYWGRYLIAFKPLIL